MFKVHHGKAFPKGTTERLPGPMFNIDNCLHGCTLEEPTSCTGVMFIENDFDEGGICYYMRNDFTVVDSLNVTTYERLYATGALQVIIIK